ncbi:MAG: phospholipase D-like domain-containing protein [Pseudomonadota bacterium]|nr:phospholipase D-like domain-containing protein [Pseudomonadota bacterium]
MKIGELFKRHDWRGRAAIAVTSSVLTLLAVLVVVNFLTGEKKIEKRLTRRYPLASAQFANELGVLLGPAVLGGNRYRALLNGDQIFPPMLAAIAGAQKTIDFETYIYWSGDIGRSFANALAERARAGVAVHVLLDWVGSAKMDHALVAELEKAGVQVRRYHPPSWWELGRLNNRTHRKLLVVDGRIGFTGGVGIAPSWTGHAQDPDHWRDSHFEIEGPAVAQMQSVFLDNWIKVSGEVLHGDAYFPELAAVGNGRAQMFSSSPTAGSESMELMYLLAITAASKTIDLSAAYFVPDVLTRRALVEAIKRGVRLRVIVPGEHSDSETVRMASRARWGDLLAAGATIAEYGPTMYHCKVMIVDGLFLSVGSTNFDNRSFRLNDEATLNIFDPSFAAEQTAVFEADMAQSRAVTFQQWNDRPFREKAGDWVAGLFGNQL